jgi:hypothetical protein
MYDLNLIDDFRKNINCIVVLNDYINEEGIRLNVPLI